MRARRLSFFVATLAVSACSTLPEQPAPTPERDSQAQSAPAEPQAAPVVTRAEPERPQPSAADALTAAAVPPPPADLWERIRGGFALPGGRHSRVEAELNFFGGHPSYMNRVVERATPYLHFIVQEVEARGMPMEIALLPVVESAFQPFAYSPGRAAGIWQFIPATGEHYGLKQTWWYDGRRDVIASTRAALDYLQVLHQRFGDWQLALAAYNSGQGTVARAIRRNEQRGKPTDFWSLDLPRETEAYVPRLLAIRDLVADPARFELELTSIPNEPYLDLVDVGSQIDLALVAELAELPLEDVYRLNPGFNRWATDPEGPHLLALPLDRVERFRQGLAELPAEKRVRWHRHRVGNGDTLSHIAAHYRTTVAVLREANQLRGNMIRAGQHLLVPMASGEASDYALSATQRLTRLQNRQRSGEKTTYSVQPGDTLWDIARAHDVSVAQLASWNGMAPRDVLRPGQDLVIWSKGGTAAPSRAPIPRLQAVNYTVRRGDSLYVIAQKFNVTVEQLRKWNKLPRRGYLQPGQRLTLHVDVTRQQESI